MSLDSSTSPPSTFPPLRRTGSTTTTPPSRHALSCPYLFLPSSLHVRPPYPRSVRIVAILAQTFPYALLSIPSQRRSHTQPSITATPLPAGYCTASIRRRGVRRVDATRPISRSVTFFLSARRGDAARPRRRRGVRRGDAARPISRRGVRRGDAMCSP